MKVSIIGAGIAGLGTAIALKKAGIDIEIFEAGATISPAGAGLGLAPNAVKALEKLGIADQVLPCGIQLPYFNIFSSKGKHLAVNRSTEIQSRYGLDNFAIHRDALHRCLLEELGHCEIHTSKKLTDLVQDKNQVSMSFSDGSRHSSDYVIAADGIYSKARKILNPGATLRYAGYTCWRGLADGTGINAQGASETWGSAGRFGIVPLKQDQIYWFACANAKQNDPEMKTVTTSDLISRFKGYHKPIEKILDQTPDTALLHNDIYDVKPLTRFAYGRVLLVGDAAHAATPNMGQGACQALEDAAVLLDELQNSRDIAATFVRFENRRLARTKMIIEQSRKIGAAAQLTNPLMTGLRDIAIRLMPDSVRYDALSNVYTVDF
ncbi:FAD-dependent monooxygenase [Pedobacter deserti]|uniref:FAD-dependent monooxygenase n=1 Tax=Pedobacter deserti TaxID=2817382 RepID=UPI00210B001E|nr:FAD-dependent monooxygenase [Pedobacter sp. SYSU D00382]